jgi:acetylornithine deacetylase/succinyl-diaminopimelate desuccinylase-like protein
MLDEKKINATIQACKKDYEKILGRLVEIPTVSSDPSCRKEIQKAAALSVRLFRRFGIPSEIVKTPGHPIVIGRLGESHKNQTVLIYNHLDVQPADPSRWRQDPFKMIIRNGQYLGRGTTDDKGPALTALFAAKYACDMGLPLNIIFVWEFEEEIGSPHFERAIRSRKRSIRCDSVLVSDTVWISGERPAIPYGIRGLMTATLHLETGLRDAHSGLVGGAARNPIGELCQVISKCHDPASGRVKIPGFYGAVRTTSARTVRDFLESGFNIPGFKKAHGLNKIRFGETADVLKAVWSKPTFEVHGIKGGYTGDGVKTVVPPRAEAKISMRLVPGQNPREAFSLLKAFVKRHNPDVKVKSEACLEPYLASPKGAYIRAAAEAMHFGFGMRPALVREGGSIGAVVSLHRVLDVPVTLLGLSLPEHGYHAPNEYFEWRQVRGGVRSFLHYFNAISRVH